MTQKRQRLANRVVTCFICNNPSSNQYGEPFDNLYQSDRWPTLFFHAMCGEDFRQALESNFDLPLTSQYSRMFHAGAIYDSEPATETERE